MGRSFLQTSLDVGDGQGLRKFGAVNVNQDQDVLVVGAGLAGLTAAIGLARMGLRVRVLEKGSLPRHKVCGEFLSGEVLPFLDGLGLRLESLKPARINRLQISAPSGRNMYAALSMDGLGLSRFALDQFLAEKALTLGVRIGFEEPLMSFETQKEHYLVQSKKAIYRANWLVMAYGKLGGPDRQLERRFLRNSPLYSGVKWHLEADWPEDTVALHNFPGGYAGVSKTETGLVNLCYLVKTATFKEAKEVESLEEKVLSQNPHLRSLLDHATKVWKKPLAISGVRFGHRGALEGNLPMLGDAAGLIAPLSGNGMALAMRSAALFLESMQRIEAQPARKPELLAYYHMRWKQEIQFRLRFGKTVQQLFGGTWGSELALLAAQSLPSLTHLLLKQSHGKPIAAQSGF